MSGKYVIVLRGENKLYFKVSNRAFHKNKWSSADVVAVINLRNLIYAYRYRSQLVEIIKTAWRMYAPVIYRLKGGGLSGIAERGGKRRTFREGEEDSG